jgi:hypothetical protein
LNPINFQIWSRNSNHQFWDAKEGKDAGWVEKGEWAETRMKTQINEDDHGWQWLCTITINNIYLVHMYTDKLYWSCYQSSTWSPHNTNILRQLLLLFSSLFKLILCALM